MSDHVFHQHGDIPDAANFAQAFGVAAKGSYIAEGFTFTVDYAGLSLDVAAGVAAVARGDMDTSDPRIDPGETRSSTAHPVQTAAVSGLSLDDGAVNHVYLDANIGTNDSPNITTNSTGDAPTSQSLKLGEIDTTDDTKSEQWHLVAADGTLTYPDQAAADAALTQLPAGTIVYDRAAGQQVISDARLNGLTVNGPATVEALEASSAIIGANTIESTTVTPADDDVETVSISAPGVIAVLPNNALANGLLLASGNNLVTAGSESNFSNQGNTSLSGTTGPDVSVNVGIETGTLYVENRTGSPTDVDVFTVSR